jgi:hypothetical protein
MAGPPHKVARPEAHRWLPRAATRLLAVIEPTAFTVGAALTIAMLGLFGILQRTLYPTWGLANLDSEASIATPISAGLLWIAAAAWLAVAVLTNRRRWLTWLWTATLAFIALDEGLAIHETLERRTEVDWQLIYLPVLAFGAATIWGLVRRDLSAPSSRLLVTAVAVWVLALALELIQNWGGTPIGASVYEPTMIAEELLEMAGSTTIALAALRYPVHHTSVIEAPAT